MKITFDDYVRLIQEKYQCTEKDAIEVLGLYKYKQVLYKYKAGSSLRTLQAPARKFLLDFC